jgi:hypothetical protein
MQEVKIKLWRNDQAQDWSIEINGLLHEQSPAKSWRIWLNVH